LPHPNECDGVVAGEVFRTGGPPLAFEIFGARNGGHLDLAHLDRVERTVAQRSKADADVDMLLDELNHAIDREYLQIDFRMFLKKFRGEWDYNHPTEPH